MKNLAPTCPDCGQVCSHPLTMPVECEQCGGRGETGTDDYGHSDYVTCSTCNGTGKVSPPPPTDEQIFGVECPACRIIDVDGVGEPGVCWKCDNTGRVGAAENRWTCVSRGRVNHSRRFADEPAYLPCRQDIAAPPELWAEIKRSWRSRTKTTVVEGQLNILAVAGSPNRGDRLNLLPDGLFTERTLDLGDGCGTWTIVVTFEPDKDE